MLNTNVHETRLTPTAMHEDKQSIFSNCTYYNVAKFSKTNTHTHYVHCIVSVAGPPTHLMARDTSCHALDEVYDDELLVVVVTAVVTIATVVTAW